MKPKEVILIVGESEEYVNALKESIQDFGYSCFVAYTGKEGINKAFELSPDLIIYHSDGHYFKSFDFFNILRESSITYDIPFVLLAENISKEELQLALEIGVDGVFDKPLRLSDMQRIVDGRVKKYVRMKRESERDFLRSFDITESPVIIYNSDFRVKAANDTFTNLFNIDLSLPLWETLGFDKNLFMRMSYKIFANHEGQESLRHLMVVNGEEMEYRVVMSSLNSIFAKRSAFLVLHRVKTLQSVTHESAKQEENLMLTSEGGLQAVRDGGKNGMRRVSGFATSGRIVFTKRQLQVLELSMLGLPMKLIADKLCISEKTVEKYRAGLMEKTGSKNIIELVIFAIKNKYVEV